MVAGHDLSLKDTFLCMTGDLAAFLKTGSAPARPHDVILRAEFVDRPASAKSGPYPAFSE
jgi:hypothetical protein